MKNFTTFPRKFDRGEVFFSLTEVGKYVRRDTNYYLTVWRHKYDRGFKKMGFAMASDQEERSSLVLEVRTIV